MKIAGFKKLSYVDFPNRISAVVWTAGCNFKCSYCHNFDIVDADGYGDTTKILSYLDDRQNLIDGVVITGGEPLLHDIRSFINEVKSMGYDIKLDTNGSFPEKLRALDVDYVAMDVKAPLESYSDVAGFDIDIEKIRESIQLIKSMGIDYEFRTTVAGLSERDIYDIVDVIKPAKRYYLQQVRGYDQSLSDNKLIGIKENIKHNFRYCGVRNID